MLNIPSCFVAQAIVNRLALEQNKSLPKTNRDLWKCIIVKPQSLMAISWWIAILRLLLKNKSWRIFLEHVIVTLISSQPVYKHSPLLELVSKPLGRESSAQSTQLISALKKVGNLKVNGNPLKRQLRGNLTFQMGNFQMKNLRLKNFRIKSLTFKSTTHPHHLNQGRSGRSGVIGSGRPGSGTPGVYHEQGVY